MALILNKLMNFLNFGEDNKRGISENQPGPVRLSVGRNLLNHTFLSYEPVSSLFVPILNETVYIPFERTLSYPDSRVQRRNIASAKIFGVSGISLSENPEVRYYPLPLYFPEEVSGCDWYRLFHFQTVSGSSLFFSLKGPQMTDRDACHNFAYCFDTESKSWSRVIAAKDDGTYYKIALESHRHYEDFPSESGDNAFGTFRGKLVIWGRDDKGIGIGKDDTPDDTHYDSIAPTSAETEECWEKQFCHNRKYLAECLLGIDGDETLSVEKLGDRKFIPLYTVSGIRDFIRSHEKSSQDIREISFSFCDPFPLRYLSRDTIGLYVGYLVPRKWGRGVFMIFDKEG